MKAFYILKLVASVTAIALLSGAIYIGTTRQSTRSAEAEETEFTMVSEHFTPAKTTKETMPPTIDILELQGFGTEKPSEDPPDKTSVTEDSSAAEGSIEPIVEESVVEETEETYQESEAVDIYEEPAVVYEEPAYTPAPAQPEQPAQPAQPAQPTYAAMTLYIAGASIPYQNGGQGSGQAIIDANPYGTASTWGGAAVQSGTDGLSTHFIGHNPGIFSAIFNLGYGSSITVTDAAATPTAYLVTEIYQVNDYAEEVNSGRDMWNAITGSGNGERVVLQSCVNDTINLIVVATK